MWFKTACAIGVLLAAGLLTFAHADARDDLAKEIQGEIAQRQINCIVGYFEPSTCGRFNKFRPELCSETAEVIADYKAELVNADTRKRAIYRWFKFVSGMQEQSDCMNLLIGQDTYCKAVNLAAKYDPHRNCPDAGRTNSTCWINRDFSRGWYLFPTDEDEWTQRCKVEKPAEMEFEE